jgi:hypothetical protein
MVRVIDPEPAPVGLVENINLEGSLLVIVTVLALATGALRETVTGFWSLLPMVSLNTLMPTPCTVIFTDVPVAGTANPGGVPTVTVVPPDCDPVNWTVPTSLPPTMFTAGADKEPTEGTALLTGTLTAKPPRTCCDAANTPVPSNRPAMIVSGVGVFGDTLKEPPMPLLPEITNPDGANVIVDVAGA